MKSLEYEVEEPHFEPMRCMSPHRTVEQIVDVPTTKEEIVDVPKVVQHGRETT